MQKRLLLISLLALLTKGYSAERGYSATDAQALQETEENIPAAEAKSKKLRARDKFGPLRLLFDGPKEIGIYIPISYGLQVSSQFSNNFAPYWALGPINMETWKIDLAVNINLIAGGETFPVYFIQPLIGSFDLAIRFTPWNGIYIEYLHNSTHSLYPDSIITNQGLKEYPMFITDQSNRTAHIGNTGSFDFGLIGFRSNYIDLALGLGRNSNYSSLNNLSTSMYDGADPGPILFNAHNSFSFGMLARFRFDLHYFDISLSQLFAFIPAPKNKLVVNVFTGKYLYINRFASAAILRIKPLYIPPSHVLIFSLGLAISYLAFDDSGAAFANSDLIFMFALNYRFLAPMKNRNKAKKRFLSIYSNNDGNAFRAKKQRNLAEP